MCILKAVRVTEQVGHIAREVGMVSLSQYLFQVFLKIAIVLDNRVRSLRFWLGDCLPVPWLLVLAARAGEDAVRHVSTFC